MLRATTMCPRTQFRQLPAPGGWTRLSSLVTSPRLRLMAPKLNSYMFASSLPVMIELSDRNPVQAIAGARRLDEALFVGDVTKVAFDGSEAEFVHVCEFVAGHD